MSFSDWKKRSKRYHDMMAGHGIGREDAEEVAQAAYKAGERAGRKQVEAVACNAVGLAVITEREACAKVAEDFDFNNRDEIEPPMRQPQYVAVAIRRRSTRLPGRSRRTK